MAASLPARGGMQHWVTLQGGGGGGNTAQDPWSVPPGSAPALGRNSARRQSDYRGCLARKEEGEGHFHVWKHT